MSYLSYMSFEILLKFRAKQKLPHSGLKWANTKVTSRMSKWREGGGVEATFGQSPKER